ncbi:YveK family protein [Indiicoccus explosivorum]|uniref:YveK family protein n=1 Tax=Indiicoccus explosivorum TaxID=1917864 RepID=UPI000B433287|nr:Wzz/FepE/Etk N-terminal domain-containing protein [Indiicoccus explosivorum]
MDNAVNLKHFLEILKKRLPLILTFVLIMILVAGFVSYKIMTPTYEAETQLLVNPGSGDGQALSAQEINASIQLIGTYNIIIKSPAILSQVIDEIGMDTTAELLTEQITVTSIEGSQIVMITAQAEQMEDAAAIANTTATVFQREIQKLMNVNNVSILSPAKIPNDPKPVKPDPLFNMTIGAIAGFLIGVGAAILLDQLNTTVRKEESIEELGLVVLGAVSPIPKQRGEIRLGKESVDNEKENSIDSAGSEKTDSLY